MILKKTDIIKTEDKYLKAGMAAEKQIAFYLHRSFARDESLFVLNGIRIKRDDDVCQMDHLIIHEYGMIIIESKSVTSRVRIKDDGSWEREWNNHWSGMRSPVIQAQMQADFLKSYLNDYQELLLNKFLGKQWTFKKMPIDVLVAISDKGRIDRSNHLESEHVFKADQVTTKVKAIYDEQKKLDNPLALSLKIPDWNFKKEAISRVANFLVEQHCPVGKVTEEKIEQIEYPKQEEPQETPMLQEEQEEYGIKMQTSTCPECKEQMEIWSKYGYFWKCTSCGKTVAIKEKCPQCKGNQKVRKQKDKYFIGCKECNIEGLYHEVH